MLINVLQMYNIVCHGTHWVRRFIPEITATKISLFYHVHVLSRECRTKKKDFYLVENCLMEKREK